MCNRRWIFLEAYLQLGSPALRKQVCKGNISRSSKGFHDPYHLGWVFYPEKRVAEEKRCLQAWKAWSLKKAFRSSPEPKNKASLYERNVKLAGRTFSWGACQDQTCGEDLFSRGAFKDRISHPGKMCLAEVLSRISHSGKMCWAEVIARIRHAGGFV